MAKELDTILDALELSEEAKVQLQTIFSAAVTEKTSMVEETVRAELTAFYEGKVEEYTAQLKEEHEAAGQKLVEDYNNAVSDLNVQAEAYLSETVAEWLAENKTNVVNAIKLERLEAFVGGLKSVFAESAIDLPESDVNLVEEKDATIAQLEESNAVLTARLKTLSEEAQAAKKEASFKQISEGLSDLQIEKLKTLSEDINGLEAAEYEKRLTIIKQTFLESQVNEAPNTTQVVESAANVTPTPRKRTNALEEAIAKMV